MSNDTDQTINPLNGKQKKVLKGLGHHLDPLIFIGKEGLTDNILKATRHELLTRELIKIRIGNNSIVNKEEVAQRLTEATGSILVQLLGKTLLLFKQNPNPDERDKCLIRTISCKKPRNRSVRR